MKKENKYAKIYAHNTYMLFGINQAKEGGPQISSANHKSANLRTSNFRKSANSYFFLLTNKANNALIQICTQKNLYKDDFLHRFETE